MLIEHTKINRLFKLIEKYYQLIKTLYFHENRLNNFIVTILVPEFAMLWT